MYERVRAKRVPVRTARHGNCPCPHSQDKRDRVPILPPRWLFAASAGLFLAAIISASTLHAAFMGWLWLHRGPGVTRLFLQKKPLGEKSKSEQEHREQPPILRCMAPELRRRGLRFSCEYDVTRTHLRRTLSCVAAYVSQIPVCAEYTDTTDMYAKYLYCAMRRTGTPHTWMSSTYTSCTFLPFLRFPALGSEAVETTQGGCRIADGWQRTLLGLSSALHLSRCGQGQLGAGPFVPSSQACMADPWGATCAIVTEPSQNGNGASRSTGTSYYVHNTMRSCLSIPRWVGICLRRLMLPRQGCVHTEYVPLSLPKA